MNAVAQIQPSRLPIAPAIAKEFDIQPTEWRVLVDQIFPAAKSVESVMMALAYCRKRNLDIFKKPVHIVPMWSSAKRQMVETVWPGIAEIRTTASRTGQYAGIDAVEFGPILERKFTGQTGGNNAETITKTVKFPEWASVVVYRIVAGVKCSYHAKVYWEETYATMGKSDVPNDMWAKRPRGQIDKCVEAAALRKAFPEELGNIYAAEEMEGREIDGVTIDHAATKQPPKPPAPPEPPTEDVTTIHHDVLDLQAEGIAPAGNDDLNADDFIELIKGELGTAQSAEDLEEVWTARDPMSVLEGDDVRQGLAMALKNKNLKRLGVSA
jgi:phage recombination protein Bet